MKKANVRILILCKKVRFVSFRFFFAAACLFSEVFCCFDVDWDAMLIIPLLNSVLAFCLPRRNTHERVGVVREPLPPSPASLSGNVSPWETSMSNVGNYYKWKSYNVLMMMLERWMGGEILFNVCCTIKTVL